MKPLVKMGKNVTERKDRGKGVFIEFYSELSRRRVIYI